MYAKPCEDHLGNKFASIKDMCKFWNIKRSKFDDRINKGFTIEEALTLPNQRYDNKSIPCKDHLGNKFSSEKEMCEFWNIDYKTFINRFKKLKWSLEKSLTQKINNKNSKIKNITDHLGNVFATQKEMCNYYNISQKTFQKRRYKYKWSLKKTLTTPTTNYTCKDHLGNEFKSEREMCKHYNIDYTTYWARINDMKWSLEKALTEPKRDDSNIDHKGIRYKSTYEMCKHYNTTKSRFGHRIRNGWTLEEALTIPKNLYIGEYRVAECLKSLNIKFYHDVTIKTIFEDLNINIDWSEFLTKLRSNLATAGYKWSEKKILKLRPDFTLYTDDDNKILGVIEFDGEQHQNFVEYFFKTIENFFKRNNADFAKQSLWEYMNLPMLRIRHDQIDNIEYMVKDFINNPENYIHNHNTYLSEQEYWSILTEQKEKLNLAFA